MEKVNLYINSKIRDNNDNINHINVSPPIGLLYWNVDEYFILNVNIFILVLIGTIVHLKIIHVNLELKIMMMNR